MSLSVLKNFYYNNAMKNFPNTIPVFPLSGVIYFPKTNLPLNIFEQRYVNLVNDTFKKDKLMGMVQSKKMNFNLPTIKPHVLVRVVVSQ